MTVSVTEIVNSTVELAAFPLNGSVAFFISDAIDNMQSRVKVVKRDGVRPNLAAFLSTQLGRVVDDYVPDYNVDFNATTKKVTVQLSGLVPSEDYTILFNTMDSYGVLATETKAGIATLRTENYRTSADNVSFLEVTAVSDSVYIPSENVFSTTVNIKTDPTSSSSHVLKASTPLLVNGLKVSITNEPLVTGDFFRFTFNAVTDSELYVIDLRTSTIESSAQVLEKASNRVNELDLIAFYEEQKVPVAPTQPAKIRRVLKSARAAIVEFMEPVTLATMDITATSGPAFNMLSLPDGDWTAPFRMEIKQLSPVAIHIKFFDSTGTTNEVIKHV